MVVVAVVVNHDDIVMVVHIVPMCAAVANDHDMVRHCRRREGHGRNQHKRGDYFLQHQASPFICSESRRLAVTLSLHYRNRAINRG